jgi:hypothetical protein
MVGAKSQIKLQCANVIAAVVGDWEAMALMHQDNPHVDRFGTIGHWA